MGFFKAKTEKPASHPRESEFPHDQFLRSRGFRIHSRGRNGATWERDDELYTEREALALARAEPAGEVAT